VRAFTLFLTLNFLLTFNVAGRAQDRSTERDKHQEAQRDIPTRIMPDVDSGYTFEPGSAIQVTIWQEPDLSGNFSIDSQGYVILPLIGKVNVSKMTTESLEGYLKEEYSSYLRNPIIETLPLIRVSVLGNVRYPGLYRVEHDRPLWDVIAMAGGPTERGDVTRTFVMRGGKVVNKNLLPAYEEGISLREVGILSGDQVVVPGYKGPFPWRTLVSVGSLAVSVWAISTRH
jgi:protein involved in polysaccharide export with SLBB domain